MIDIHRLFFEYPGVLALNDISLRVRRGDICALVGPNGAGKTTLLRCIAALDRPVTGSIVVNDVDVLENPRRTHQQIGYLADFYGLYAELNVRQSMVYAALAHSIPAEQVEHAVQHTAARLNIEDRLSHKVGTLSRGLKQRLAIAQAIVHQPALLLLDEPASGLDPEARRDLSRLFVALRDQGMTLLISSHILAELEEYSTSMVILRQGKIIEHQALSASDAPSLLVRLATTAPMPELIQVLGELPRTQWVEAQGDTHLIRVAGDKHNLNEVLTALVQKNIPVYSFTEEKINMHDAYLQKVSAFDKSNASS